MVGVTMLGVILLLAIVWNCEGEAFVIFNRIIQEFSQILIMKPTRESPRDGKSW